MKDLPKHRFMLLAVIGLVALLPILAYLQYNWIGKLSESEVTRMRSTLQTSAQQLGQAIDHEIYPAQWAFRVSFTRSIDEVERQLRRNYRNWASRSTRPELIENIYWVDYDDQHKLRLHRFDTVLGELQEEPWPEDLGNWRTFFIERNRRQLEQYNPRLVSETYAASTPSDFLSLSALLMAERPAIPIPVSIDSDLASEDLLANLNATSSGQAGHTLLTFDKTYLTETFLPELRKELICRQEQDVDMLVVSNADSNLVIYRSDPKLTLSQFENPDAKQDIARFRWMSFTPASSIAFGYASLMDRDDGIADSLKTQAQRALEPAVRDSFLTDTSPLGTDFPLQAIIRLAEEEEYRGELTAEHLLTALTTLQHQAGASVASSKQVKNVNEAETPPRHAWTVLLRHRMGSLEASVQANQRRNLFLSFGILLMLGFASVMIFTSSRRARLLADHQMNFVTGVSHELRTPLTVIRSAADNLADGVVQGTDRIQKYGLLISREGKRLSDMVEQIMELAGIQSGKKEYQFQPISPKDLIEHSLSGWRDTIASKDFIVSEKIDNDLPQITGDAKALELTISNLINNALKYSNGSRWIGISAEVAQNGRDPELRISVADKGKGIPPEELPHIFDQFYRGQEVQKAQIHGNGIGLSIVKSTIEAHGGRITVDSKQGQGSTFVLHFPLS